MTATDAGATGAPDVLASRGTFAVFRLRPGDDVGAGLRDALAAMQASAMAVVTCVGSLRSASIRYADRMEGTRHEGRFEIVSLNGTVDPAGLHVHVAISDEHGRVVGGHLLPGCTVRTTAEVVVVALADLAFARAPCPLSGHRELTVAPAGGAGGTG